MCVKFFVFCLGLLVILTGSSCSSSKSLTQTDTAIPAPTFTPLFKGSLAEQNRQVQRLVTTLTTESPAFSSKYDPTTVGFVYTPVCSLYQAPLPLSYWTSVDYFGKYAWQIYYSDVTGNQVPVLGQAQGPSYTANPQTVLNVVDTYSAANYTATPTSSTLDPSGAANAGVNLQYERMNTANGTDIYDGACYQIALALASQNGLKPSNSTLSLQDYIDAQSSIFSVNNFNGIDGNDSACVSNPVGTARGLNNLYGGVPQSCVDQAIPPATCGITTNGDYPLGTQYNTPQNTYFDRMVTQQWTSLDPFFVASAASPDYLQCIAANTSYCGSLSNGCGADWGNPQCRFTCSDGCNPWCVANELYCEHPSEYTQYVTKNATSTYSNGTVTWADYKPVTGENVWGILMGPMTAANITGRILQTSDPEYIAAKGFLTPLSAMQSKCTGGIYYAAQGSLGNVGSATVNPFQISTENNASTLGALLAFKQALSNMSDPDGLTPIINNLIWGSNGSAVYPTTNSILGYFKYYAWNPTLGYFKQGITEQYDSNGNCTAPFSGGANAVDVNTWGIAALTPHLVDTWFGVGTAYQIWQNVKNFGGYYDPNPADYPKSPNNLLAGVGYSDQDNNGPGKTGGIMSAEWTFGAINLVRSLMSYYGQDYSSSSGTPLSQDEYNMVLGVSQLHSDSYATTDLFQLTNNDITTGRPPNYVNYVPVTTPDSASGWFLYASKRYFIPFGWFANPLPSLTSTSWAVMTQYGYNPFNPTGAYTDWWASSAVPTLPLCENKPVWFVADNGTGTQTSGPGYLTGQAPFGNSTTPTSYVNLDAECLKQAARLSPQYAAYSWKAIFLLPDAAGANLSTEAVNRGHFLWNSSAIATYDPAFTYLDPNSKSHCYPRFLTASSGGLISPELQSFPNLMLFGQSTFNGSVYDNGTSNCSGGTTNLGSTIGAVAFEPDTHIAAQAAVSFSAIMSCSSPFNMVCAAQYLPACTLNTDCSGTTPSCETSTGICKCTQTSCTGATPVCNPNTGVCTAN